MVGSGGAGKSTLARHMGQILGLPVIHLDRHYWKPGWVESSHEEWDHAVTELASGDAWVMDGNYGRTIRLRLRRADAVVFLDFPPWRCLLRVVRRRIASIWKPRPDMPDGFRDRLTWEFLVWIATYPKNGGLRMKAALADFPSVPVHRLRTPGQVEAFLRELAS